MRKFKTIFEYILHRVSQNINDDHVEKCFKDTIKDHLANLVALGKPPVIEPETKALLNMIAVDRYTQANQFSLLCSVVQKANEGRFPWLEE